MPLPNHRRKKRKSQKIKKKRLGENSQCWHHSHVMDLCSECSPQMSFLRNQIKLFSNYNQTTNINEQCNKHPSEIQVTVCLSPLFIVYRFVECFWFGFMPHRPYFSGFTVWRWDKMKWNWWQNLQKEHLSRAQVEMLHKYQPFYQRLIENLFYQRKEKTFLPKVDTFGGRWQSKWW